MLNCIEAKRIKNKEERIKAKHVMEHELLKALPDLIEKADKDASKADETKVLNLNTASGGALADGIWQVSLAQVGAFFRENAQVSRRSAIAADLRAILPATLAKLEWMIALF